MHFLVALGRRDGAEQFILSVLSSGLLKLFHQAKETSDSKEWIRYSQNASYICRCMEMILHKAYSRGHDDNTPHSISANFLNQPGKGLL